MTYLRSKRKIAISDYLDKSIKLLDSNGTYLSTFNQPGLMHKPWSICSNSRSEIFLHDWEKKEIIKFDSNMKCLGHLGDRKILNVSYMAIDNDNESVLYISHYIDNKITIWNLIDSKLVHSIDIDSPEYMQINRNKIYVTSHCDAEYVDEKKELKQIKNGSNCIFIINKNSYAVVCTIRLDDWVELRGLYIDENSNIITTAFKLDEKKIRSDFRYLYTLNERKNIYSTIYLNNIEVLSDMLVLGNKFFFCISDIIDMVVLK